MRERERERAWAAEKKRAHAIRMYAAFRLEVNLDFYAAKLDMSIDKKSLLNCDDTWTRMQGGADLP